MDKLILGIDLGTTSLKTAVFDYTGGLVACATVEYELNMPKPDFVEVPPQVYLESAAQGLRQIREQGVDTRRVEVIGFSAQGETLLFVDGDGRPLRDAIVWMDNRAGEQAEALRERFGDKLCYEVTGQVSFEPCWPAPKVLWVKEHEPELFARVHKVLLLEDYVIHRLTGKYVSEGSLLTSTLYWDIRSKRYWPEMLDAIGLREDQLPRILESGVEVGVITAQMAEALQVSPAARICTGCLDQAAGAIGVGNIRPGIFSENIGAALAICVPTGSLTYDPNAAMPVHCFPIPDSYMMHSFTTGGMTLRWFRDAFCQLELDMERLSGLDAYYLLDRVAEQAPPGSEGLLTLPHLSGSMPPDMNAAAKGVFFGATLQHKKAHFVRSIMESLGYIICRNIEALEAMGIEVGELRSLGGGSKSPFWNQIKADITGKQLRVMECTQEVACLGAAILAGVGVGVFDSVEAACERMVRVKQSYTPDPQAHRVYRNAYAGYKRLMRQMEPLFALGGEYGA